MLNACHYREISVHSSHGSTPHDMEEVIKMLARRTIEIGDLITHRFPLDSIEEAFLAAERTMGMHVAVCP